MRSDIDMTWNCILNYLKIYGGMRKVVCRDDSKKCWKFCIFLFVFIFINSCFSHQFLLMFSYFFMFHHNNNFFIKCVWIIFDTRHLLTSFSSVPLIIHQIFNEFICYSAICFLFGYTDDEISFHHSFLSNLPILIGFFFNSIFSIWESAWINHDVQLMVQLFNFHFV